MATTPYTVTLTDGTTFATIPNGTVNTDSSMTLIGKNYAEYGQMLADNFIRLLENASNTTAPPSPITGQLWWDKSATLLKVYSGTGWKNVGGATASSSQPSPSIVGDLWFDTTVQQLKICSVAGNPGTFIVVGAAVNNPGNITLAVANSVIETVASTGVFVTGVVSATGNVTGANIVSNGLATVTGNVQGGNLTTAGLVSATGTVTGSSLLGSVVSASANITGGNVLTGGLISATGTVTGSSLLGSVVSASGNVTGGNIVTGGIATVTGNAQVGNLRTVGLVSASGGITSSQFTGSGAGLTSIPGSNVTGTVANATYAVSAGSAGSATTAGTVTGATQSNITGVGTLTGLTLGGTLLITNATSPNTNTIQFGDNTGWTLRYMTNVAGTPTQRFSFTDLGAFSATGNITGSQFNGSGAGLTNIPGGNVSSAVANATFANSAAVASTAYSVTGSNVSGAVGNANYAVSASSATSAGTAGTFTSNRTNYLGSTNGAVAGQLMWKNYGNGHTIFDASNSTSPDGNTINNQNAQVAWTGTYPTLMGWNGTNTYGVRVDSARVADSAGSAGSAGSATTAGTVTIAAQGNITSLGILTGLSATGIISTTGNITGGNVLGGANVNATTHTGTTVSVTGNITGSYFIGNGSQLTGITSYSNTNATSLMANFGSNTISMTSGNLYIGTGTTNIAGLTVSSVSPRAQATQITSGIIDPNAGVGQGSGGFRTGDWQMGGYNDGKMYFVDYSDVFSPKSTIFSNDGSVPTFQTGKVYATSGFIAGNPNLTPTANISGGNINVTTAVSAGGNIEATGTVRGGSVTSGGAISATGAITGSSFSTSGNVNITSNGRLVASGISKTNYNFISAVPGFGYYIDSLTRVYVFTGTGGNVITYGTAGGTSNLVSEHYIINKCSGDLSVLYGSTVIGTIPSGATGTLTTNRYPVDSAASWSLSVGSNTLGVGISQTWQDLSASRALNTSYTNTTGRPIMTNIFVGLEGAKSIYLNVGGYDVAYASNYIQAQGVVWSTLSAVVPPGAAVRVTSSGVYANLLYWYELR
jgi:hypothetical protein